AVLWGGAAVCFLASFVVYMLEPRSPSQESDDVKKSVTPAKAESASAPSEDRALPDGSLRDPGAREPATEIPSDAPVPTKAPETSPEASRDASADATPAEREHQRLIRRGNPFRWVRGGITAFVGSFAAFFLMAHSGQFRWGVPVGALF